MLPYQPHVPYAPSRLNPSFPLPLGSIPSPLASTNAPAPQPFPSPPIIVGGGRFGKRKLSVIKGEGRGTRSMPTSPLRQSINTEVWQGPHSASAYSSQPPENINVNINVQQPQIPSFFSDRTISSPDHEYDNYAHHDHDHDEQEGDDVPPPRKKRAQVRVACTHCQKACKKCSNTRPCERCVKYGLPDCNDSMRKPRKTGVKRGPYKRRTSSLYQQDQYPLIHTHTHHSQPAHRPQEAQTYFNRPHLDQPLPDPITQAFAAAFDKPTWVNGRRQSINPVHGQGQGVYGYAAPPPPPPPFQNTFIPNQHSHGEAPRQRIPSISTSHISPTNTIHTDGRRGSMSSIFPISLHTLSGQDPFSRTVSPIGYKFSLPLPSNLSTTTTGMDIDQNPPLTQDVDMEGINNDYSMSSITPPEVNVVDFAYSNPVNQDQNQEQGDQNQVHGMVYHSAPTSPRGTRMDTDMNTGRAVSAEPPHTISPSNPILGQKQDLSMSMGMITPIPMPILGDRKPSLFTLMNSSNHTTQAQAQSSGSQDSPTLFDGLPPLSHHHSLDNTERERRMSYFGSLPVPNAGGVGRLSLSKGSEGIGLGLGLEHIS